MPTFTYQDGRYVPPTVFHTSDILPVQPQHLLVPVSQINTTPLIMWEGRWKCKKPGIMGVLERVSCESKVSERLLGLTIKTHACGKK